MFGGNRRVAGLRREEVAILSGVSVDYYTRLKRGNLAGFSESVLDAPARALQLDNGPSNPSTVLRAGPLACAGVVGRVPPEDESGARTSSPIHLDRKSPRSFQSHEVGGCAEWPLRDDLSSSSLEIVIRG